MPPPKTQHRALAKANKTRKKAAADKRKVECWKVAVKSVPRPLRELDLSINMTPSFVDALDRELRACRGRIYRPRVAWLGCGKGQEAAAFMLRHADASAGRMLLVESVEEQARAAHQALIAIGATLAGGDVPGDGGGDGPRGGGVR